MQIPVIFELQYQSFVSIKSTLNIVNVAVYVEHNFLALSHFSAGLNIIYSLLKFPKRKQHLFLHCVKRIVLAMWTEKELTDLDRNLVCQAVSDP